jgi:hypothetical protein
MKYFDGEKDGTPVKTSFRKDRAPGLVALYIGGVQKCMCSVARAKSLARAVTIMNFIATGFVDGTLEENMFFGTRDELLREVAPAAAEAKRKRTDSPSEQTADMLENVLEDIIDSELMDAEGEEEEESEDETAEGD